MNKRTYIIFFVILTFILAIVTTIYIVKGPAKYDREITGNEAKKYSKIFNLKLENDENEKYYVIKGLSNYQGSSLYDIEIPEIIDGIKVRKIISDENKFSDYRNTTKLFIPKYIVFIGIVGINGREEECYFENAINLKEINISNENQYFKSIDGVMYTKDCERLLKYPPHKNTADGIFQILENVKKIDSYAFFNNNWIQKIIINNSIEEIGSYAFARCTSLKEIVFDSESCLKSIKAFAFQKNENLKSILLPENLEEIQSGVFNDCQELTTLYIPSSVNKFGNEICALCPKIKIYTPEDNYNYLINNASHFNNNKDFVQNIFIYNS